MFSIGATSRFKVAGHLLSHLQVRWTKHWRLSGVAPLAEGVATKGRKHQEGLKQETLRPLSSSFSSQSRFLNFLNFWPAFFPESCLFTEVLLKLWLDINTFSSETVFILSSSLLHVSLLWQGFLITGSWLIFKETQACWEHFLNFLLVLRRVWQTAAWGPYVARRGF